MMHEIVPNDIPPLTDYQGAITLVEPTTGRMFYRWWDASRKRGVESEFSRLWRGVWAMVDGGYLSWDVSGVPVGELDERGDNVPLPVLVWAGIALDAHFADQVSLKKTVKQRLSGSQTQSDMSQKD